MPLSNRSFQRLITSLIFVHNCSKISLIFIHEGGLWIELSNKLLAVKD